MLDVIDLSVPFPQTPPDGSNSLGCSLMEMDKPVAFEHEVDFEAAPALRLHHRKAGGVHYTAKVRWLKE